MLIRLAKQGNLKALELLLDRSDGKVPQDHNLTIREEARRIAEDLGVDASELIAEAERIAANA